jgi:hypothetical protein
MEAFRVGLSKAIRESKFFPDPIELREVLAAKRRHDGEAERGRKAVAEFDALKAKCEQERKEDAGNPKERTETEKRLDDLLAKAKLERKRTDNFPYPIVMTPEQIKEAVAKERGEQ